ncbi:MAG: hypothetical protein ACLBM4_10190 [Dolichospermum sp.]|nr:hypothetical protein [Dolichospermum circinale Clear-D4]
MEPGWLLSKKTVKLGDRNLITGKLKPEIMNKAIASLLGMWECDRPSADLSVRSQWRNFWN